MPAWSRRRDREHRARHRAGESLARSPRSSRRPYQLAAREQQITRLIARGFGTAEIAGQLHLSAHTVRDYLKTIFEKVDVSSRGELVAKLFAEHYARAHVDPEDVEVVRGVRA